MQLFEFLIFSWSVNRSLECEEDEGEQDDKGERDDEGELESNDDDGICECSEADNCRLLLFRSNEEESSSSIFFFLS